MDALKKFSSRTVVLPFTNIDTDQIIPARFLRTTGRAGLGKQSVLRLALRRGRRAAGRVCAEPAGGRRVRHSGGGPEFRMRIIARTRALGAA